MKHIALVGVFSLAIGFQFADIPTVQAASPEAQIKIESAPPAEAGDSERIAPNSLTPPNLTQSQLVQEEVNGIKIADAQSKNYCLGADPALSDRVRLVTCNSSSALKFVKPSNARGQFRIVGTKICLHVNSGAPRSSRRLHVRPCAKEKNQRFELHKTGLLLAEIDKYVCATPYALTRNGIGRLYPKTPLKDAAVSFSLCEKKPYQYWLIK